MVFVCECQISVEFKGDRILLLQLYPNLQSVIGYGLRISISSRKYGNKDLGGTTQEDDPSPA